MDLLPLSPTAGSLVTRVRVSIRPHRSCARAWRSNGSRAARSIRRGPSS